MKTHYSFFLVIVLLTACNRLFGPSAVLTVSIPREPATLDWTQATDPVSFMILLQMQRGLTKLEGNGKIVPDLAEGWSLDVSGRRFTFVLAKDRWSDGVELTAGDFLFAWKRVLSPSSKTTPQTSALLKIEGARDYQNGKNQDFSKVGVRAINSKVFEVTLEKADGNFSSDIASCLLGPQREDVFQLHPKDFTDPLHLRTLGPYQILEWKHGESLLLVSNSYSTVKPSVAKIRFAITPDAAKANLLFKRGELDILSPSEGSKTYTASSKTGDVPLDLHGDPLFYQLQWK